MVYEFLLCFFHPIGQDDRGNPQVFRNQYIDVELDDASFARKTSAFYQHEIKTLFNFLIFFDDLHDNTIILVTVLPADHLTAGQRIRLLRFLVQAKMRDHGIDMVIQAIGLGVVNDGPEVPHLCRFTQ